MLIFENIHLTLYNMIKFLVNICNQGKNLQDVSAQKPCLSGVLQNIWSFIIFFISKNIIPEIR